MSLPLSQCERGVESHLARSRLANHRQHGCANVLRQAGPGIDHVDQVTVNDRGPRRFGLGRRYKRRMRPSALRGSVALWLQVAAARIACRRRPATPRGPSLPEAWQCSARRPWGAVLRNTRNFCCEPFLPSGPAAGLLFRGRIPGLLIFISGKR